MAKPQIQLKKVWKTYQVGKINLEVLKGVDLEIEKGEFIVLLGPSGSGKSTLLNIMSCLDVPSKGHVYLDGQDVSLLSEDELAEVRGRKIGFVFQQFNLLHHLSALENVTMPAVFQKMDEKERKRRANDLLDSMGLKDRVDHTPNELSGGEKQRVAIARSLINDPEIVVADEPTGEVDTKTGEKIMKIFTDLHDEGRTIIIVTHDVELVNYATRVIRIRDGELEPEKQQKND
ncbi:MAG: ABC transporter ATP-binding protein [Patescibacteria group bacterium]